jgi:hypothetical protein
VFFLPLQAVGRGELSVAKKIRFIRAHPWLKNLRAFASLWLQISNQQS